MNGLMKKWFLQMSLNWDLFFFLSTHFIVQKLFGLQSKIMKNFLTMKFMMTYGLELWSTHCENYLKDIEPKALSLRTFVVDIAIVNLIP